MLLTLISKIINRLMFMLNLMFRNKMLCIVLHLKMLPLLMLNRNSMKCQNKAILELLRLLHMLMVNWLMRKLKVKIKK